MTGQLRRILAAQLLPPLIITIVLGGIGVISLWAQEVLLIPSIASAIFVQTLTPDEASARTWNTGIGQLLGAASGFVGVSLTGAGSAATFMGDHSLASVRVFAAVIAVFLTVLLQKLLKATSAAGGATALIVALGAETATLAGAARLVAGIVIITAVGEVCRLFILRLR